MTKRMPMLVILAGIVSSCAISAALNASAEQSAQAAAGQAAMPPHDHNREFSSADRSAFFDAKVAALHAGLTLTPDQDKLWPPVEAAIRNMARTMSEQNIAGSNEPRPSDPVQILDRLSARQLARGQALKDLADAAKPFYATLNDGQKHRLPILLAHLHPHWMHFAMAGESRIVEDEGDGGDQMKRPHDHDNHGGSREDPEIR